MPARAEVYAVRHDQRAHRDAKNQGLTPGERQRIMMTRLEDQIARYNGEFILKKEFTEFFYEEVVDLKTGQNRLHAPGFIGPIAESYDRAIWENRSNGLSARREEAECDGFHYLEKVLLNAPVGTCYLWISPPGTKEEGYGDYSFTHLGRVEETSRGRRINVTSLMNILTLEEHAQIINYFLPEGKRLTNPRDVDFLRNPAIIYLGERGSIHDLLLRIDLILGIEKGKKTEFAKAYQERKNWERELIEKLRPVIADYYSLLENGAAQEQLQQVIWAMENYTREWVNKGPVTIVNERPVSPEEMGLLFYEQYNHKPPALEGGSCPTDPNSSTDDSLSSAVLPFQEHRLKNSSLSEGEKILPCKCPTCHQKVKAVIKGGKIHCPNCGASAEYKC